MQNICSEGTIPEKKLIKALKKKNIYFAINVKTLYGKPDIVFRKKKTAVFVDSDFFHGHPKKFIMPKSNISYWQKKIVNNKRRDRKVNSFLRKEGWNVIRIWESQIKSNVEKCADKILMKLSN